MTQTANEQFLDAVLRHQIHVLRYSSWVRNRINELLLATEEDVGAKIARLLAQTTGLRTPEALKRYYTLVEAIKAIRGEAWAEARNFINEQAIQLTETEVKFITGAITTVLPTIVEVIVPPARQLREIAVSRPFEGRLLKDWASKMEADDLARISAQIQLGMVAGEDAASIARRVLGTGLLNGEDGVTNTTRRQVQAITRTAVQHIANNVRAEVFAENSDLFGTEVFIATLDGRTTPVCRANDHKHYPAGKGPLPPLHFNCRSLRVAMMDPDFVGDRPAKPVTERMLVREYKEANGLAAGGRNTRNDLPYGHKTKYDTFARKRIREVTGPIPAATSYDAWLRKQSVEFQEDILGKTKAKLFRDGGLKLDKFIDRKGDELTLAQLAKRDARAFIAAGLDPTQY